MVNQMKIFSSAMFFVVVFFFFFNIPVHLPYSQSYSQFQTRRKAMIRNRYNYLTSSVQDTKVKKGRLKQWHHNQNTIYTSITPKEQFLSRNNNKKITRTYRQRHSDRNSKPQQKHRLGTVSKNFTCGALSSAVVYTRHLFSPREGVLSHQCNISENIKIKRIQRRNNNEDSKK